MSEQKRFLSVENLLPRRRVRFVAWCVIGISAVLLAVSLLFSRGGHTPFGTPLGGDFPSFYVAGKILTESGPDHLYDLSLQSRRYLQLVPGEKEGLPYAYPPIVAVAVRPLAGLPYRAAVLVWAMLTGALYAAGLAMLWRSCPAIPRADRWVAVWLSVAFEPFAFECLHGGQISALAFAAVCAAIFLDRRGRPFAAGLALGVLAYKPTLLALIPLALLLDRQWKTLAGMGAMVVAGVLACLWSVGWGTCAAFGSLMLTYARSAGAGQGFATWKFVDLSAFWHLMMRRPVFSPLVAVMAALLMLPLLPRRGTPALSAPKWVWALCATLVVNLYVGIYDTVLVVAALWLMADACYAQQGRWSGRLGWLMAAVFVTPWISQPLARYGGVQLDTLVLALVAIWAAFGRVISIDREAVSVAPNPLR